MAKMKDVLKGILGGSKEEIKQASNPGEAVEEHQKNLESGFTKKTKEPELIDLPEIDEEPGDTKEPIKLIKHVETEKPVDPVKPVKHVEIDQPVNPIKNSKPGEPGEQVKPSGVVKTYVKKGFVIRDDLHEVLESIAYWNRTTIKEELEAILLAHLKGKKIKKLPQRTKRTKIDKEDGFEWID